MHVRLGAADFVDEDSWSVDTATLQVVMDDRFDLGDEKRRTFLGMPSHVQVDLGVEVSCHVQARWRRLKPNSKKPRERGSQTGIVLARQHAVNAGPITAAREAP